MLETIRSFVFLNNEFGWLLELALCTAGWVILRFAVGEEPKWYRVLLEFILLHAVMCAGFLFCVALVFPKYSVTIPWGLLNGAIAYLYLRTFSTYRRPTRQLLWVAMFTSSLSIMPLGGLGSYLVSYLYAPGALATATRSAAYILMPLIALYLRRFSFDEYRAVPKSGMRMFSLGIFCVLVLYVVESQFMNADYSVMLALLTAYLCMLLMTCMAIQSMHTMCREQNALLELQAEKQRFLAEREMTQMAEDKLEDLRCIRHDLKNQYSYMQILLAESRYEELQQYFAKLSQNLPAQLNMIDCGNHTVNTVLNMELAKLRSDRITFEHQLVVPPVLPFPDEDVCAIITKYTSSWIVSLSWNRMLLSTRYRRLKAFPWMNTQSRSCGTSTRFPLGSFVSSVKQLHTTSYFSSCMAQKIRCSASSEE